MKIIAAALIFGSLAFADTAPQPQQSTAAVVKSSPSEDALIKAAKDFAAEQKAYNDAVEQNKSNLNSGEKDLQKQYQDTQKQLMDKLNADKHYKPLLDKLSAIQKQAQDVSAAANQQFSQKLGPIQNQMATDNALIQGLIPVVRQENGLPDSATFDTSTQTWKNK